MPIPMYLDDAFALNDSKVNDYIVSIFRIDLEIKGITHTARYAGLVFPFTNIVIESCC